MTYLLIKRHWVCQLKSCDWFFNEAVPYPDDQFTPEFLQGAYFVPEFRIKEHKLGTMLFLGAFETLSFSRKQTLADQYSALEV